MRENAGLQAHYAVIALREMDNHGIDEWWVGDDLVSRFECERVLGIGEDDDEREI